MTGIDDLNAGLLKDVVSVIAAPFLFVINLSLQTGIVPSNWKVALVTPLCKKGDKTEASNYRSISILLILSQILQRSVHYQLVNYLEQNILLSERQYSYRKKRSTELATAYLVDEIRKAADKGLITGVLLVDLSKAFGTLGYSRLITKLQSYGIKGQALQLFTDYSFACHQVVKFNNETSEKFPLTCGVPQGSILGTFLFLLFFNDFKDSLDFSKSLQFADDTVIYYSGKSIMNIEEMLNHDISSISKYLKFNELIINLDKNKTEALLLETAKCLQVNLKRLELHYDQTKINVTESYTYLGSTVDPHLTQNIV